MITGRKIITTTKLCTITDSQNGYSGNPQSESYLNSSTNYYEDSTNINSYTSVDHQYGNYNQTSKVPANELPQGPHFANHQSTSKYGIRFSAQLHGYQWSIMDFSIR